MGNSLLLERQRNTFPEHRNNAALRYCALRLAHLFGQKISRAAAAAAAQLHFWFNIVHILIERL